VPLVAAHHERPDGRGYYRGLAEPQTPLGARIIAVADSFDELTRDAPDRPALTAADAFAQLRAEAGRGLSAGVVDALGRELGAEEPAPAGAAGTASAADGASTLGTQKHARPRWPAGLSDREVEILRLLAKGLSRRELAGQLFLSEHTVRHHLEHIYNKLGVSTRVAATLFAVEHDLLR
jgi:DNA-binding CsgD family transcriptional regulator